MGAKTECLDDGEKKCYSNVQYKKNIFLNIKASKHILVDPPNKNMNLKNKCTFVPCVPLKPY